MDQLIADWEKERPDLDATAMHIVGRIMRLSRRYEKQATNALKPFGLSYTEFDILATLRRSGAPYELTPGQLGQVVLLTSGAMTAALDRLERSELITRNVSPADRRVKTAKLTKTGQSLALKAAKARFAAASNAVSALSNEQKQALTKQLRPMGE